MENLLTVIVTLLIGSPLMAVLTHILNRRARHAEARLKNAEADQKELDKKKDEVDYYRGTIELLVADMEALRLAQDATDQRYRENTAGLHRKIDELNNIIGELRKEVKDGGTQTATLIKELERANLALDKANEEITGLREEITGLQDRINDLLVERAEKK